jgi:hypothetical protein
MFCKNILNVAYRNDGMNKSYYSKSVVMEKDKSFTVQCFPNFKETRQLNKDKHILENNYTAGGCLHSGESEVYQVRV